MCEAKTLSRLWPLVQSSSNQRERWRAGELVLAIGGEGVVAEFLKKLPSTKGVAYEPEELEGYAKRMGQMKPLPKELLRAQLSSPNWWQRVIALRFFERKGDQSDLKAMKRLVNDAAGVNGEHWDAKMTVGKVAKNSVEYLDQSLKTDKSS
ncbi:MAG: hypothetical protein IPJ88_05085 [Myxococcales bacterium]|nr:MAG: hypothetical protein IPJ88_05085 [Myxococcales bacterium]